MFCEIAGRTFANGYTWSVSASAFWWFLKAHSPVRRSDCCPFNLKSKTTIFSNLIIIESFTLTLYVFYYHNELLFLCRSWSACCPNVSRPRLSNSLKSTNCTLCWGSLSILAALYKTSCLGSPRIRRLGKLNASPTTANDRQKKPFNDGRST